MPHSRTVAAPPRRRSLRGIGFVAAATLALAAAVPAHADGATVTAGDVNAFATSSDPGIVGRATMVRTADGKTIVTVHAEGLLANTTYGSHVHLQACANGNAAAITGSTRPGRPRPRTRSTSTSRRTRPASGSGGPSSMPRPVEPRSRS